MEIKRNNFHFIEGHSYQQMQNYLRTSESLFLVPVFNQLLPTDGYFPTLAGKSSFIELGKTDTCSIFFIFLFFVVVFTNTKIMRYVNGHESMNSDLVSLRIHFLCLVEKQNAIIFNNFNATNGGRFVLDDWKNKILLYFLINAHSFHVLLDFVYGATIIVFQYPFLC